MERTIEELRDDSTVNVFDQATIEKRKKYGWPEIGEMGEFMLISKWEIKIDRSYQRDACSMKKILEIARMFNWALFGTLSVIHSKDGKYYVFDGGHRLRASFRRGEVDELPCMVYPADTQEEEAWKFYWTNVNRTSPSAFEKHWSLLCAKDETAIMAEKIVRKHGYRFVKTSPKEYEIATVNAVYRIITRDPQLADLTIELITKVAGGLTFHNEIIYGLFYIISTNQHIDFRSFPLENMKRIGLPTLEAEIRRSKALNATNGTAGQRIYAQGLEPILNKGRPHNSPNRVRLPV